MRHFPGETIGIIGSSISSALLAQAAGKLGYRVASLVLDENNPVRQFSSWQTVTDTYNDQALTYFAGRVDTVTVEVGLLTHQQFLLLSNLTELSLTQDIMAITTDRLLEKNFLEQHQALVTPYSLVTNLLDIEEAVEYLGFPCILKSTQRIHSDAHDHVYLYSEDDYVLAEDKLANGSCILEAYVPITNFASLTVVRNERGEILLYPIFEKIGRYKDMPDQVRYPASISQSVAREINRLGKHLTEALNVVGTMTFKFFITKTGLVYVNEATIGLGQEAIFTIGSMSMSHYEATARALFGLPLPNLRIYHKAAIAMPVEQLNIEKVLTQFMLRTDWGFALYNPVANPSDQLIGQVIVTGDSIEGCLRQIEITELNI